MPQSVLSGSRGGPTVYEGHTNRVHSVAYSPDGKSVVSGSADETIRMWDADTPSLIGDPLKGHTGAVWSISYSPLGNLIISGSEDHAIRLWDTNTRQQVGDPLQGHDSVVTSVAFSPGGNHIASGSLDTTIRIWDVKSKVVSRSFDDHTDWVWSVAFSPDGTRIVSGSLDKTIRIWDVEHGTTIVGPLEGHAYLVRSVVFSPDGSQIVSGSYDQTLRLWDSRTGGTINSIDSYKGHTGPIHSVAFSPDGIYVASGAEDRTVRVWDVRTGHQVVESFRQHTDAVNSVTFSPSGSCIASGSDDTTIVITSFSGGDSDIEHHPNATLASEMEQLQLDNGMDTIDQYMSVQDMLDLLSRHGCVNLQVTSQMDPNQDSATLLSGGGFGDIWRGELFDGTKVAIKAWRASLIEQCDYKTLKRATREIHHWSKMKHENVHELMGVIMFKGQSLGMVSEWMENGNLHEYLRKNPKADRYQLSVGVASGLAYVHGCNMIHGDIKALNVLVSSDRVAKLTDFGLSTMSESSIVFSATSTSQAGSVRWMAPELLLEESPKSKSSDVYALGMTILVRQSSSGCVPHRFTDAQEIFTGTFPYSECRQDVSVTMRVMQGILPVRSLRHFMYDKGGDQIWNLLLSCWVKEPDARPLAKEVAQRLVLISALN